MPFLTIPVSNLLPGDVITTDADDVTVEHVEPLVEGQTVRVFGRITRGYGASHRVQRWTRQVDQMVDVVRVER